MITLKRTGSMASVIAAIRDVPARVVPYAAATALTRVAKRSAEELKAAMGRSFDRPTPFVLNSLFVVPATKDKLEARVAVKNLAGGQKVTVAEKVLFPGVFAGGRREKRFERAMRYAGILAMGERAMQGERAPVDQFGNIEPSVLRAIVRDVGAKVRRNRKTGEMETAAAKRGTRYFVGAVRSRRGVWQRDEATGRLKPMLIFTRTQPRYRERLDFTGVASRITEQHFEAEFRRAAAAILAKGPRR